MNEVGTKKGAEGGTQKSEGDEIGGYQGRVCGRDEVGTERKSTAAAIF